MVERQQHRPSISFETSIHSISLDSLPRFNLEAKYTLPVR